jgi:hypothetical protein
MKVALANKRQKLVPNRRLNQSYYGIRKLPGVGSYAVLDTGCDIACLGAGWAVIAKRNRYVLNHGHGSIPYPLKSCRSRSKPADGIRLSPISRQDGPIVPLREAFDLARVAKGSVADEDRFVKSPDDSPINQNPKKKASAWTQQAPGMLTRQPDEAPAFSRVHDPDRLAPMAVPERAPVAVPEARGSPSGMTRGSPRRGSSHHRHGTGWTAITTSCDRRGE